MRTMTLTRYRATIRKLHHAHLALKVSAEAAEYFESVMIYRAMSALREVPDVLRVQVCADCRPTGYRDKSGDPYASMTCRHPGVPRYNVRTGEEIQDD